MKFILTVSLKYIFCSKQKLGTDKILKNGVVIKGY